MLLSEKYINRLQKLAGILLTEVVTDQERNIAFADSNKRVPFNKDMMVQAIKEGRELGVSFQSNNDKYKMPVAKYRILYPVAMGLSKKGNLVIRAFHVMGQSESEAIETGNRSAEVENEWRLLKASNIKSMWFTGNFFRLPLPLYNANGDASMVNIEVQANAEEIVKFQDGYNNDMSNAQGDLNKRKNIVHLFKNTGERPVEKPIQNPTQNIPVQQKPVKKQPIIKPKPGFKDQNPNDSI